MKATKGKANPAMLDQLLKKLIDEGNRVQHNPLASPI